MAISNNQRVCNNLVHRCFSLRFDPVSKKSPFWPRKMNSLLGINGSPSNTHLCSSVFAANTLLSAMKVSGQSLVCSATVG